MQHFIMNTDLGLLRIEGDANGLTAVQFLDEAEESKQSVPDVLKPAVDQLKEYFSKERKVFNLRLNPGGTEFQRGVWEQLLRIPFGKTKSYQDIANDLGDPNVIRAAASANGKNPIAIIIPCHRVIGSDGSLTGYAGGIQRKKWLLEHESPVRQITLF
jgi:methylated-DNA-[protein]-cysteine S-methyltransferase